MSKIKAFDVLKNHEDSVVGRLDTYLNTQCHSDDDRAQNVNAPSQIGKCLRERYYGRLKYNPDGNITPRSIRIFDNGTRVHLRLQDYLKKEGVLLMDEVPVLNNFYNIQGHTDGILKLSKELAILEIKSINSRGFEGLKDIKEEHKKQGSAYAYCIENRRKYLHKTYKTIEEFNAGKTKRQKDLAKHYTHLKDGSKHTAKEKLEFQLELHETMDKILFETDTPITKVIFLYECKDNQELREFTFDVKSQQGEKILSEVLSECDLLNDYVESKEVPPRQGSNPNSDPCRWCDYKIECWG